MTTLEIDILGPIGQGYGNDPSKDLTAESVSAALAEKPSEVRLRINSPGGSYFEALAIHNLLRSSGARVEVQVLGLAASAASLIAMAGDDIAMATGALMMLHNPWTMVAGNAADLRAAADDLDKLHASAVEIYAARSGRTAEEVGAILDAETWLSSDDAISNGFAHRKLDGAATPVQAPVLARMHARSWEPLRVAAMVLEVPPQVEPAAEPTPEPLPSPIDAVLAQVGVQSIEAITTALKAAEEVPVLRARTEELGQFLEVADANLSAANAKATAAEAEAKALRQELDVRERAAIVAKLTAERKICPAMDAFVAGLTLDALRAFADVAPVVVPQSKVQESATQTDGVDRWHGKTWAELRTSPAEMRALYEEDPDLFARMKSAAEKSRRRS